MTTSVETAAATGRVARVIGPVVDVEFPVDAMPEIYNALRITGTAPDGSRRPRARVVTVASATRRTAPL